MYVWIACDATVSTPPNYLLGSTKIKYYANFIFVRDNFQDIVYVIEAYS